MSINKKNIFKNTYANELTDSLQAQLHLSLEKLSDGEFDQEDLDKKKSKKTFVAISKTGQKTKSKFTADNLHDSLENRNPLPHLLQKASLLNSTRDSLDDTLTTPEQMDLISEEDSLNVEKISSYDALKEEISDPYADLRYNYKPLNNHVLQPVENIYEDDYDDDVMGFGDNTEYSYYDNMKHEVDESDFSKDEDEKSLEATNAKMKMELEKLIEAEQVAANNYHQTNQEADQSAVTGQMVNNQKVQQPVARRQMVRNQKVQQPVATGQMVSDQRAQQSVARGQMVRNQNVQQPVARRQMVSDQRGQQLVARGQIVNNQRAQQPVAMGLMVSDQRGQQPVGRGQVKPNQTVQQPFFGQYKQQTSKIFGKVADLETINDEEKRKIKSQQMRIGSKDYIEKNRSRVGKKSSSASYLEIYAKRAAKAKQKVTALSSSAINEQYHLPELRIAKSEANLQRRRRESSENVEVEEMALNLSAEQAWKKQAQRLKRVRNGNKAEKKRNEEIESAGGDLSQASFSPSHFSSSDNYYPPYLFHYPNYALTSLPPRDMTSHELRANNSFPNKIDQRGMNPYMYPPFPHPYPIPSYPGFPSTPYNGNIYNPYLSSSSEMRAINGGYIYPPHLALHDQSHHMYPAPNLLPGDEKESREAEDQKTAPKKLPLPPIPTSKDLGSPESPKTNYKTYTLNDYRNFKKEVKLGGLGPDLSAAKEKSEKSTRAKKYSDRVRMQHREVIDRSSPRSIQRVSKIPQYRPEQNELIAKRKEGRERALNYAKKVPKPKLVAVISEKQNIHSKIPQIIKKNQEEDMDGSQTKRRSSSTFTVSKDDVINRQKHSTDGEDVNIDLIRELRERHEREKAIVAHLTAKQVNL